MLLLCHGEHAHQAWNTDRAPADQGLLEGHGRALGVQKQIGLGGSGRGLTPIKSLGFFAIKVQ